MKLQIIDRPNYARFLEGKPFTTAVLEKTNLVELLSYLVDGTVYFNRDTNAIIVDDGKIEGPRLAVAALTRRILEVTTNPSQTIHVDIRNWNMNKPVITKG